MELYLFLDNIYIKDKFLENSNFVYRYRIFTLIVMCHPNSSCLSISNYIICNGSACDKIILYCLKCATPSPQAHLDIEVTSCW